MKADLAARDDTEEREGGVWAYISPSRLNLWLRCPLAWKLKYIDGIRTPTSPSLFLGKVTHDGLQVHYRHRMLGIALEPSEIAKRLVKGWDQAVAEEQMVFQSAAEEAALQQQAVDLVLAYLAQAPKDEPRPLAVEAAMQFPLVDPVTGEDLGIPLLGIVDLILPGEAGATIIDFKTAAKSAPPLEISHEIQLSSYSWLFRNVTSRDEAGLEIRSLIKTRQPKIEFHCYAARSEAHFRRLFAVVREYLDALDSGRFNYRPGWGCGMCEYREGPCSAWLR